MNERGQHAFHLNRAFGQLDAPRESREMKDHGLLEPKAAYHKADAVIQELVDLVAAQPRQPLPTLAPNVAPIAQLTASKPRVNRDR